jgi:glycosyltransferase involved in cell wall biosynthesis
MGQQNYERHVQEAMQRVAGSTWRMGTTTVSSLRSPLAADARLPMGMLPRVPPRAASLVGRLRYPRADLLHRFDLQLPPGRLPEVVTVHDLAPLRFPDEGRLPRHAISGMRRAFGVICPSQFAAGEIRDLGGVQRVWVVPNGISSDFREDWLLPADRLRRLGIRSPYVLHAGGSTERKNLPELAHAWRLVHQSHGEMTLVLCGPDDQRKAKIFAAVPQTVMPGRLPHAEVAALMRGAAAVVVPSVYEGFGLPALEAMASGTPVVAVRRGSLPEVCGDAAMLVEPSGAAIAAGLRAVLEFPERSARLSALGRRRAAQYDWDTAARAHLDVYGEVLDAWRPEHGALAR